MKMHQCLACLLVVLGGTMKAMEYSPDEKKEAKLFVNACLNRDYKQMKRHFADEMSKTRRVFNEACCNNDFRPVKEYIAHGGSNQRVEVIQIPFKNSMAFYIGTWEKLGASFYVAKARSLLSDEGQIDPRAGKILSDLIVLRWRARLREKLKTYKKILKNRPHMMLSHRHLGLLRSPSRTLNRRK